jgi:hypothetical protein
MFLRRFLTAFILMTTGLALTVHGAKPSFTSYELESGNNKIRYFDFNKDGLDDIIVIDEPNLVFFFQDPKEGFTTVANLVYPLENKPSVIWNAKLGNNSGQNILIMTDRGVSTLTYVSKTSPLEIKKIISRQTIIPEKCEKSPILYFNLSANTAGEYPLLLVPTEDNLEIWKFDNQWRYAYSLEGIPHTQIWGPQYGPQMLAGYTKEQLLDMNIGDLNSDGIDDLVVCENNNEKTLFNIYLQTKGAFSLKPSLSFEEELNWRKWICLQDINRDGHVDIIKTNWLQEAWFLPIADSGKVIVQIFIAGPNGDIPGEAQYVFRKSDWTPSLPIVDIDGDGFIDLVLGFGQFDSRESIRKAITAKKLNHTLRFHFYNGKGFDQKPNFETEISVQLDDRGPIFTSRGDRVESRINLDGDFNGDGSRDLLVLDRADKASVYFFISREKGFSKKADIQFNMKSSYFVVSDLNHDKISDLIVSGRKLTVFLSKKDK